jgi:hypothetical protein
VITQGEWSAEPFDRPIDVDLRHEGPEWEHHLRVALREIVVYRSLSVRRQQLAVPWGRPVEGIEYAVESSGLQSRLWVTLPEYRVLIVGEGAENEGQIAPWAQAVNEANTRLANQHTEFRWAAIIGPTPQGAGADGLAETATVGPLRLRPGGVRIIEYARSQMPSFFSRNVFWSWPAIVEGTVRSYSWQVASQAAARDLIRLCALLSVAWRRAWHIRQAPIEGDGSTLTIPEYAPFEQHTPTGGEVQHTEASVPAWVTGAWEVVAHGGMARNALTAYYEGLLVEDSHPSLALLAFVAAIEAVGKELHPTARPTERFQRALRLVASEPEADVLRRAYADRSDTVHEAVIHGSEVARGAPSLPSFFGLDRFSRFELEVVGQLNRLSRNLLHLTLKGELEAAQPLATPTDRDPFEAWPKGALAATMLVEDVQINPSG